MSTACKSRVVGIVQARLGSTRLPGKVLAEINGEPLLAVLLDRLQGARSVDAFVIATTNRSEDDAIAALAAARGLSCYRGSESDVLDRYYQAATHHQADVVVRLTGDNPIIDGEFVSWAVDEFLQAEPAVDYAISAPGGGFPVGVSVEILRMDALAQAWREDHDPASREHVTPFIRLHPELFPLLELQHASDQSKFRLTVDTAQDLALIRKIYGALGRTQFSWCEVPPVLAQHPEWLVQPNE